MGNCCCFEADAGNSAPASAATASCPPSHVDNRYTNSNDRSYETDELLSQQSPIKNANHCDSKQNSFKKSPYLANGVAAVNASAVTSNEFAACAKEPAVSDNSITLLYLEYKDPDEDQILSEGIERLCKDLDYQPDDFAILVLAWCLDASQMYRFTRKEFVDGLHKMAAATIESIQKRLQQTIELLKVDAEMFKQLYRFTFRFGLEPEQRILPLDMAMCLWKLVFTVHTPELLTNWLNFLEQHPGIGGISKDTWNMFLNFSEQCDINNYDDTEAWPSLFDDFVDYEKSRLASDAQAVAAETLPSSGLNGRGGHTDDDNNNDDPLQLSSHQKISPELRKAPDVL